MKFVFVALFACLVGVFTLSTLSNAATFEVQMLNKDPDNKKLRNVFRPAILRVNPGDTVRFISVDRGHNSQSLPGMFPQGAEEWSSKVGKDFEVTLKVPGVYGYRCTPHFALGMVGLIVVAGDDEAGNWDANLAAAKSVNHPRKAKKAFQILWPELDALMSENSGEAISAD